jgi:heat shock protein HslJ
LPTVTAVPTPEPEIAFWADSTVIDQGQCTTLRWDVKNIQAIWVYPLGEPYQNFPVTGTGSRQECPLTTTTYEMRVQRTDGLIELRQVTIQVNATNPLANTSWRMTKLNGNNPVGGVVPMAFFYDDGRLSADGGCNKFSSTYSTYGDQLYIGALSGGRIACGGEVDTQEITYINALQSATTFSITGGQLILKNNAGTEVLSFNRAG